MTSNAVDIGVRVEVPAVFTDAITADLYEPKLLYRSAYFEDPVRTFCMNPHGVVSTESYGDVVTVNGHSYADHDAADPLHQLRAPGIDLVHSAVQRLRSRMGSRSPAWRTSGER